MWLIHLSACTVLLGAGGPAGRPFAVEVVDSQTGRGVPLVELRTVHGVRLMTDSAGVAAFFEPGLMDRKVFFHVVSHGYEFPAGGFGFRGKTLQVTPGGSARLEIQRVNVAERLYRVTGAGIYRDSLLAGREAPTARPLLNAQVLGSDSVNSGVYRGKIYWFWGDTNRPGHPLGNFKVPGATSELLGQGGLDPEWGIDLEYFVDRSGFAKKTIAAGDPGPTWISGLVVLEDTAGGERMFAHYVNIRNKPKGFEAYERGLVEFDDERREFRKVATFPLDGPFPSGAHTLLHVDGGTQYVYYCDPYPQVRVAADPEKLKDLSAYEAFTCLAPGSRLSEKRFDRAADGSLRWAWKPDTDPHGPGAVPIFPHGPGTVPIFPQGKWDCPPTQEKRDSPPPAPDESPWGLRDAETGKPVAAHRGSVAWNAYRKRWIMIAGQIGGTSMLGEVWYAEADRLTGPWRDARKIVTHDDYSFYNPKHHAFFDKDGGRVIFFEGTYTRTFSGNRCPTPRYDYNQVMYKLDLDDVGL